MTASCRSRFAIGPSLRTGPVSTGRTPIRRGSDWWRSRAVSPWRPSRHLVEAVGADIKDHEVVIFDFSGTTYLDDSAARLIGQLLDIAGDGAHGIRLDGRFGRGGKDADRVRRLAARAGRTAGRDDGRGEIDGSTTP